MPMTREQAEKLLDLNPDLRRLGANRDQAVLKIMQLDPAQIPGSPLAAVRPQGAIRAALEAAEPKPVTPASPAPMKPGVPVMAPRPEAKPLPQPAMGGPVERARAAAPPAPPAAPAAPAPESEKKPNVLPERIAAQQALRELEMLNQVAEEIKATGQDLPAEAKLRIDLAQRKAQTLTAEADAIEAAQINPDVAKILARQETGIEEERARLAADKARSPWDALTAGGLALMNPRKGANFLGALGEGLGAGLETYDTARAQAAERKARLGKEFDQIALQRIDALEKARQAARDAIRRGDDVDERTLRMSKMTREEVIGQGTQQAAIDLAVANASKAKTEAQYAGPLAESEIRYRDKMGDAAIARGQGAGDGGPSDTSVYEQTNRAARDATEKAPVVRKAFKDWQRSANGKANVRSGPEWDAYQAELRIYQDLVKRGKMEKVLPNLGPTTKGEKAAARNSSGSSKAALRYDPKTGTFVSP